MASTLFCRWSQLLAARTTISRTSLAVRSRSQRPSSTTANLQNSTPIFVTPEDHTRTSGLKDSLQSLLKENGGKWSLTPDSQGISRRIQFKTFKQASSFIVTLINRVADVRHHPTWTNTYNVVDVTWSTHKDKDTKLAGISELDVQMAQASDEIAGQIGEQ